MGQHRTEVRVATASLPSTTLSGVPLAGASAPAPGTPGPRLKPAYRPLWRGAASVQLGIDLDRAVVVDGLSGPTAQSLRALDRGLAPAGTTDAALMRHLASVDALESGPPPPAGCPLAPERALLGLLRPEPDGADAALAARARSRVLIVGGGRTGAAVAHVLAASGLGRVSVEDPTPVRAGDACPAGVSGADVGLRRGAAATALAVRAATPVLGSGAPDVAVFCPDGSAPPDPDRWWPLLAAGSALLCASVRATRVIVGPFTLPFGQGCPGCLREHRIDRDPAWPLVERQLADPHRRPADTATAATVLALASATALQVLSWLDSGAAGGTRTPPPSTGATLELPLPGWEWHRRTWGPHPSCRCASLAPPA